MTLGIITTDIECCDAKCRVYFIAMLNVGTVSEVKLSVVMLRVVILSLLMMREVMVSLVIYLY
jgi:hypothetical protein